MCRCSPRRGASRARADRVSCASLTARVKAGTVRIDAFDDDGTQYGPLTLEIGAGETVHFNSGDLEQGNADKGLTGAAGSGEGSWRLALTSPLDIEVLSYLRTHDGFVTSMHDLVP